MIKIMCMLVVMTMLFACTSNSGSENTGSENTTTEETPVEVFLETRTEVSADNAFRVEYQVDTNTNKKHGLFKEFDVASGQLLAERTYNMDKIDGVEKLYFPDTPAVDGIMTYKDGKHHGEFSYFYRNGQLKQKGEFVDGTIEGLLIGYYEDGTPKEEITHVDGMTQGPFKEYNPNGTLKAEGEFTSKQDQENLEHGLLKLYDENGELNKKMICKQGQCCTIWTVEDGDVEPSSKLCQAIISSHKE